MDNKGIAEQQIVRIEPRVDGSQGEGSIRLPAIVISIICLLLAGFMVQPMLELALSELDRWEHNVLHYAIAANNLTAIIFTLSSLTLVYAWLMSLFYPNRSDLHGKVIWWSMHTLFFSLILLLMLSAFTHWYLRGKIDATLHLINLLSLVCGVALLIYLLYAPQLFCLSRQRVDLRTIRFYDHSLFVVLLIISAIRMTFESQLIDLLFTCAGVLLAHHGLLLARSQSSFIYLINELKQWPNIQQFYPNTEEQLLALLQAAHALHTSTRIFKLQGGVMIMAGLSVSGYSLYQLAVFFIPL